MRNQALKLIGLLSLAFAVTFLAPLRAAAQSEQEQDYGDDPPSRVARLSHTDGSVSFNPAGTDDWVAAVINRPMTTGDKLWADNNSRAELHIGSASLRIGNTTGFSFLNLTDDVAQVQLTEGTLRVRVKRLNEICEQVDFLYTGKLELDRAAGSDRIRSSDAHDRYGDTCRGGCATGWQRAGDDSLPE